MVKECAKNNLLIQFRLFLRYMNVILKVLKNIVSLYLSHKYNPSQQISFLGHLYSSQMSLKHQKYLDKQYNTQKTTEIEPIDPPQAELRSYYSLYMDSKKRTRVPTVMHSLLRQTNSYPASSQIKNQRLQNDRLQFASMLRTTINSLINIRTCQICLGQFRTNNKQSIYLCDCEHKFNFCQSCLHHYVIFKVNSFAEVPCPNQTCTGLIQTQALLFKQLPIDIQKKYKKIHQFYQTANDPNKKLCPKQNCQGIIAIVSEGLMVCSNCECEFCAKCLLVKHQGLCDQHELAFFRGNFHYRQCVKCRIVIEKNQGCNHMTCRCGYEFCYVCGAVWEAVHYGNHDQNGNFVAWEANMQFRYYEQPIFHFSCCNCCDNILGERGACILKFPLKCLVAVSIIFFFSVFFLFVLLALAIMIIYRGCCDYSLQFVRSLNEIWCVLGWILFPLCLLAGILKGLKQVVCEQLSRQFRGICNHISSCLAGVF